MDVLWAIDVPRFELEQSGSLDLAGIGRITKLFEESRICQAQGRDRSFEVKRFQRKMNGLQLSGFVSQGGIRSQGVRDRVRSAVITQRDPPHV